MNNQEIKKSIANRRAIHWKGEWDMVCSCGECPMPYRTAKNPPQLECMYYGGKDYDKRISIEDDGKIHSECGLPLWNRVRWYTPDELPSKKTTIEIKYRKLSTGEEFLRSGECWGKGNRYKIHDGILIWKSDPEYQVISWRYIL